MNYCIYPSLPLVLRISLVTLFTLLLLATNVAALCTAPVFSSAPSYATDRLHRENL